jgi:3-hydroxyisobutyrate dehydrogenase-like beta-hydroxyacid dehydrogenase
MPKKSRKNVGLIGLGIIGSRVANALRSGGYHVFVWNRTPRAAPNFLGSPRQVAELCDIIQIFVSDAQALFEVIDAMGDALTPHHVIVCNATVGPEATLDAARSVQDRGAQFLDAPFTGSKAAAQNRELVYYIGGDEKTLKTVEPVLQASSKAIVKIGKIGDAAVLKVATNMIAAVTVQTLAEAYAIVKESGIDPRSLNEALKHHGVRSGVADAKLTKILDRDYDPHFSLKHMFKDVQLGIHIANSLDIDLPATTATAGVMYGGLTRGWADEDFAVLGRIYQKEPEPAPLPPAPKPADLAPAAPEEKKEPPRESTPEELRNMGIKVPEPPAEPISEPPKAQESKTEEPKPEPSAPSTPVADVPPSGHPNPEPKPDAPKPDKAEPPKPDTAPDNTEAAKTPENAAGNGAPADPARQHTPFVRIRRWFGTGAPS